MLVYANSLWFQPDCSGGRLLAAVSTWLGAKVGHFVHPDQLKVDNVTNYPSGSRLQTWVATGSPYLHAVRYSHPDPNTPGRQWVIEIGFRQEDSDSDIKCTILVRTDEISARVSTSVQTTRPNVVTHLIKACKVSQGVPGQFVIELNDDVTDGLRYIIDDDQRRFPLILVSEPESGASLIDCERLRSLVVGLADVIHIPATYNTHWLARVIGDRLAPYGGAVSIVNPPRSLREGKFVHAKRLLPLDLQEMRSDGPGPETEILSIVTHRSNLPNSWQHISPEMVRDVNHRRELARRREQASSTGEQAELIEVLEEINAEQVEQLESLRQRLRIAEEEYRVAQDALADKEDERRQLAYDLGSLKATMSAASQPRANVGEFSDEQLIALRSSLERTPTPSHALQSILALYPERVVVLDSAWKSAEESDGFIEKQKAFDLLWKLVTQYWQFLADGVGDAKARKVFGSAYAAQESETVRNNARARELRTFIYKGSSVEMMRHLKIGVKDSKTETLRIHFMWDADDRVIVIGHCGPHLDFK